MYDNCNLFVHILFLFFFSFHRLAWKAKHGVKKCTVVRNLVLRAWTLASRQIGGSCQKNLKPSFVKSPPHSLRNQSPRHTFHARPSWPWWFAWSRQQTKLQQMSRSCCHYLLRETWEREMPRELVKLWVHDQRGCKWTYCVRCVCVSFFCGVSFHFMERTGVLCMLERQKHWQNECEHADMYANWVIIYLVINSMPYIIHAYILLCFSQEDDVIECANE